jgi:ribosome-associated toxin RatA of RatAB toxin-antitoxin module
MPVRQPLRTVLAVALALSAGSVGLERAHAEPPPPVQLKAFAVPGHAMARIEATLTIPAPPERVWSLVSNCNRFPEFMDDVKQSRELERHGPRARCSLLVDVPFPFGTLRSISDTLEERRPGLLRQSWKLVSGDFYYDEGFWELTPDARGGTIVRYVTLTEPKLPLPRGLLQSGQEDFVRDLLLRLRKRLLR